MPWGYSVGFKVQGTDKKMSLCVLGLASCKPCHLESVKAAAAEATILAEGS